MEERLTKEDFPGIKFRVESYYDILENEDNELMFTLKDIELPIDPAFTPRMYYDGGEHAIFIKNKTTGIICDYIHPGVRGSLGKVDEVLVAELKNGEIDEEYMVDVIHIQSPDVADIAGEYVTPIK